MIDGESLGSLCRRDATGLRRSCQDTFALLVSSLGRTNATAAEVAAHVHAYNHGRPAARQFSDGAAAHRQLPGLRARPWLDPEELPEAFGALAEIRHQFAAIKAEVLSSTLPWDPLQNDPTLTTNAQWNARECWDSVSLYFNDRWVDTHCETHLPVTCGILKAQADKLEPLFRRASYSWPRLEFHPTFLDSCVRRDPDRVPRRAPLV